jgi:hypothetical protein
MTATVISLADHRRPQAGGAGTCPACARKRDGACFPHRLDALARRLTLAADATDGELLVDREAFERAISDALTVIASITAECLSPDERSTR